MDARNQAPSSQVDADLLSYIKDMTLQYETQEAAVHSSLPESERPRSRLSFNAVCSSVSWNKEQEDALEAWKQFCIKAYKFLLSKDAALNPSSPLWEYVNENDKLLSTLDVNPHIYLEKNDRRAGFAGVGNTRNEFYMEEYRKGNRLTVPHLLSIVNIANIPVDVQIECTEMILDGLKEFKCDHLSDDIAGEIKMEMLGLPIDLQKFCWGLCTSLDKCKRLGGSIEISGHLLKGWEHIVESGFQGTMQEEGYPIQGSSIRHEAAGGRLLTGWLFSSITLVEDRALECVNKLITPVQRNAMESGEVTGKHAFVMFYNVNW